MNDLERLLDRAFENKSGKNRYQSGEYAVAFEDRTYETLFWVYENNVPIMEGNTFDKKIQFNVRDVDFEKYISAVRNVLADYEFQFVGEVYEEYFKEQLENASAIEYKGIIFDEWTIDEETGGIYGEMCECCAEKYKDILSEELSDGGMGACSVKGCDVVGMDADTNSHYYVDFKPELIRVHEMRQEKEMENGKGLDSKILNAKEMQKEASAGKGEREPSKEVGMEH